MEKTGEINLSPLKDTEKEMADPEMPVEETEEEQEIILPTFSEEEVEAARNEGFEKGKTEALKEALTTLEKQNANVDNWLDVIMEMDFWPSGNPLEPKSGHFWCPFGRPFATKSCFGRVPKRVPERPAPGHAFGFNWLIFLVRFGGLFVYFRAPNGG